MVQSRATDVEAFLEEVDAPRRPAMARLRALYRAAQPGWEERMQWGMPGYGPAGGDARLSFNAQKNHIALYFSEATLDAFRDRLGRASCGKGCLRYAKPEHIDYELVEALLAHAVRDSRAGGGAG